MMIATETALENLTLDVRQEIHVKASLETAFEALLEQLGPHNEVENGPMPMKLEAWRTVTIKPLSAVLLAASRISTAETRTTAPESACISPASV